MSDGMHDSRGNDEDVDCVWTSEILATTPVVRNAVVQDLIKFFEEMRRQKPRPHPELNTRTFWDPPLDKCDKVLLRVDRHRNKMQPFNIGLYRVHDRFDTRFVIVMKDGSLKSVAKSSLKPYHELSAAAQNSQQPVVRTEQEETHSPQTLRPMKRS
ncbi:unnamed protein product [Clavelina lepadiformis]|uniref:Uncharacterized protein n=1 Tax=Clavelina lepadiformis TaxID=159417 RepID=A0ABP0FMU6_CLALP